MTQGEFSIQPDVEGEPERVVRGRVRLPDPGRSEGGPPWPWTLVLHGFKGFMDWGFFPELARRLAEAGVAAVSFNASGSGIGSDFHTFSDAPAFRRDTLSRLLQDVSLVRAWVVGRDLEPLGARARGGAAARAALHPGRGAIFGHSRGGGAALVHAAHEAGLAALATWAALDSFDRWDHATKLQWRRAGVLPVANARTGQVLEIGLAALEDYERQRERFDILAACARIRAPALLLHGSADEVVEARALERLRAAFPDGVATAVELEGQGHTFGAVHPLPRAGDSAFPTGLGRALDLTVAWLAGRLRPPGTP